tara:strand:+ start:163138 stop:163686 length:549 start_codon:yes stop_codon:yes gene_type:complete
MKPNRVTTVATLSGDMGSLGRASNKLFCQRDFPLFYCEQEYVEGAPEDLDYDRMIQADSDRISGWDYEHARRVSEKFFGRGGYSGHDIMGLSEPKRIEFLREILKADEHYPDREWTGYRVTGTVNVSNGFPIYSLWLFSKGRKTETEVNAPNTAISREEAQQQDWRNRDTLRAALTEEEAKA